MTRDPIPLGTAHHRQPSLLAQFDRHENRAIMVRDGRASVGCVHLTSPMVRVWKPKPIGCTPIAPWYLHALNFTPVARMERSGMRERPIRGSQATESPLPDFAFRSIRATDRALPE